MHMTTSGPAIPIAHAGLPVARQFANPAPPRDITIATGQPDGAYHLFATRHAERLAVPGITLHVRTNAGSMENVALLCKDGVRKVAVPLSCSDELYHPHLHIDMLRGRLRTAGPAAG